MTKEDHSDEQKASEKLDCLKHEQHIRLRRQNIATVRDLADVLTDADSRPRIQELLGLDASGLGELITELDSKGYDTSLREPTPMPPFGVPLPQRAEPDEH